MITEYTGKKSLHSMYKLLEVYSYISELPAQEISKYPEDKEVIGLLEELIEKKLKTMEKDEEFVNESRELRNVYEEYRRKIKCQNRP